MSRKLFWLSWLISLIILSALSAGYAQQTQGISQTPGQVVKFDDDLNTVDSVITESNGNVGVGTTSPQNLLHIGSGTSSIFASRVNAVVASNSPDAGIAIAQNSGVNVLLQASGAGGYMGTTSNHPLVWRTNDLDRMGISENGNVGIPTINPISKLNVITPVAIAVRGESTQPSGCAIDGVATATAGLSDGVRGTTSSPSGRGVVAVSAGGAAGNLGLQVFGRARATGGFATGSGAFEMDNPLDPANKYLRHAFVGSPDMKNIYDGVVVLDANGEALVDLPEWFEAINRDFRYQLTCIGGFAPVYVAEKISDNRFKISGGQPGLEVSWQVSGIRKDPYAEKYGIRVEEEKPAIEKGLYLHPDAYGQPQTKSIQ